jgi:hypothetical protein
MRIVAAAPGIVPSSSKVGMPAQSLPTKPATGCVFSLGRCKRRSFVEGYLPSILHEQTGQVSHRLVRSQECHRQPFGAARRALEPLYDAHHQVIVAQRLA